MFLTEQIKRFSFAEKLVRRNPLFYPAAHREFQQVQEMSPQARRQWTQHRVEETLKSVLKTRYGKRIGGSPAALESWPLLDKQGVRDRPRNFVAGNTWFGTHTAGTTGTTGMPMDLYRSPASVAFEQVCIDWLIEQLGIRAETARIAVLRGDIIDRPDKPRQRLWRFTLGGRRLFFSSGGLTPATVDAYAGALEAFRPDLLCAYPTSLEKLCRFLRASGRKLHLPRVLTSSEVLHTQSWNLARGTLGCKLIDYYGQGERLAFACASEPKQYRFVPGYAHVELLPVPDEAGGLHEIVGTSLWNFTMPLVRYRTGDLIRLPPELTPAQVEEVAYGLRTFDGVLGRNHEVLVSPEGARLTGVIRVADEVPNLLRIQIIQESLDQIRILVLPDFGYVQADEARLAEAARARIPASMKIQIETAQTLECTGRGKAPLVIHRPGVLEALQRVAAVSARVPG